ncbi:hypothetical protein CLV84_1188 [Neolewinella xylanilytica]|uniref:PPC domain-containing protein n=1 Tax=Neolewinella xylanilytica TaxID=1514080 RepID=A0A2S6I9Q0_9BACT|nr:PPC domain-containing DNA-binding protein [Neolewinella xylanilytica]PPK88223.1 hypothetical protein CLV84_1188 [Neolewinella xylanilytica]
MIQKFLALAVFLFVTGCQPSSSPMPHAAPRIHAFRLAPGEDLREEIQRYVEDHRIEAGYIVTCVGSLTDWQLRFANQPDGSTGTGHFEIVSLVGTVSMHGSHLHLSVSDGEGKTIGGHLLEGNVVYTTAEIVIGESLDHRFIRTEDPQTGYRELEVETRR